MGNPRLDVLRSMVEQQPDNAFSRYGLAMEYLKGGDLEGAAQEFDQLLARNPTYAAAYFHGGQTLEKLGKLDEARAFYRKGIEVTAASGDSHTQSELTAALQMLD
ncbi:MAG TPA: tetratricopeptide repeat protein [Bryobacteraceae bacterium]|nr:tetratricopeptide repeat protein [Bryobacteraceae bacterium]